MYAMNERINEPNEHQREESVRELITE